MGEGVVVLQLLFYNKKKKYTLRVCWQINSIKDQIKSRKSCKNQCRLDLCQSGLYQICSVFTQFIFTKMPKPFNGIFNTRKNDSSVTAVWIMLLLRCQQSKRIYKFIRTRIVIVQSNNLQENVYMIDFFSLYELCKYRLNASGFGRVQ